MAIGLELVSIILRRRTIEERYPGGFDAYWAECPNGSFVADEHLARFGAMSTYDIDLYADELLARVPALDESDLAIVAHGSPSPPWLVIGDVGGVGCVWLAGVEPGSIYFFPTPEMLMAGEGAEPLEDIARRVGAHRSLGTAGRSLVLRGDAAVELDLWEGSDIVTLGSCHQRVAGFGPDAALRDELIAELVRGGWRLPPSR